MTLLHLANPSSQLDEAVPEPLKVVNNPQLPPSWSSAAPTTASVLRPPRRSLDTPRLDVLPDSVTKLLTCATRLRDLDPASLSLHKVLHRFRALTSAPASVPYSVAFNWDELDLPEDDEGDWYCVAFRSKWKIGSDIEALYEADALAHEEAISNGGLILYWYGTPDEQTGLNLATCIWQSRKQAVAARSRPHHIKAAKLAAASYDVYRLERYILRKTRGTTRLALETVDDGSRHGTFEELRASVDRSSEADALDL